MRRRALILIILCFVLSGAFTTAHAADAEAYNAAGALYDLGLFSGTGTDANGTPNFDLDRTPTRHEAVTMLVSLLGKKEEALAGTWETPFTDVADWAKPYVGYAYANGLTSGTSDTTYSGNAPLTAAQYLTFILKALGYETGTDFQWDKSFDFSDQIGLTDSRYQSAKSFLRGDVTIVSRNALDVKMKGSNQTLADKLIAENVFTADAYKSSTPEVSAPDTPFEPELPAKPAVPATPSIPAEKIVAYLTTPQYTKEQIDQWVTEGLTVEQWAEKIKVPADAVQMLNALNYRDVEYNDNVTFYDSTDTEWGSTWNAKTVFDHRSGNCGGTSNIINTLFADDFDQQGYVEFNSANGGHIFNYFVSDGVYVFCDFVGIPGPYSLGGEQVCPPDTPWFVVYTTSSPEEFGDWYRNKGFFSKEFDDPNQEAYLYQLFMYPCDGVKQPKGRDSHSEQTKFNNPVWDVLPEQYKDDYIILYEREGHPLRFRPIPERKTWPSEIH